jgi:quercetin dioxygenase-like cupin family protein
MSTPQPHPSRVIESPTHFVVEDYAPGLTVDFRTPPERTDLDRLRERVQVDEWRALSFEQQLERADALCCDLGIAEQPGDFVASLQQFAGEDDVRRSLSITARAIATESGDDGLDMIGAVLKRTGVLQRAQHYPVRLYCHNPELETPLEADASHFGYVLDGEVKLELDDGRSYPLYPHSTFCAPGPARIRGAGRVEVLTSFGHQAPLSLGGPVEAWGRLRYIDGCTDTVLVPPTKLGDPCYNALYFPPHTKQTQHTHPSLRAGIVVGGRGICRTPSGDHPLEPGRIFLLPPECWHAFHTDSCGEDEQAALTVIAFHPDSDFGPTDENHPMLNRTYFRLLHRLRSTVRSDEGSAADQ